MFESLRILIARNRPGLEIFKQSTVDTYLLATKSTSVYNILFNCYFKECFNAEGRTKNRDIVFLRLFSLGFQRSFKTEVLCCTQSVM